MMIPGFNTSCIDLNINSQPLSSDSMFLFHLSIYNLPNNTIIYFILSPKYDSQIAVTTFKTGTSSYYFLIADAFDYATSVDNLRLLSFYLKRKVKTEHFTVF